MSKPSYDQDSPVIVPDAANACVTDWDPVAARLQQAIAKGRNEKPILVVECYPGVNEPALLNELKSRLSPALVIHAAEAFLPPAKINRLVRRFFDPDDPASGSFCSLSLVHFIDAEPLWRFRRMIEDCKGGLILIVGYGASLIAWGHILVYADLVRREAERCLARDGVCNLGIDNHDLTADLKYQHAFFVDWPVADRWKRPLIAEWDFVLDGNDPGSPKLAEGDWVRHGLHEAARGPFRLTPNPVGQAKSFGRNFAHTLEENSLLLGFGDKRIEIPLVNVASHQPRRFLGEAACARFDDSFPLRFNSQAGSLYLNPGVRHGKWKRVIADGLMNRFRLLSRGEAWREEKSPLAEGDFVQVRRRWFTDKISNRTHDTLHLIRLVQGEEIIIESPAGAFAPLVVRDTDMFVVPAAAGEYTICGVVAGRECATLKVFVRA